MDEYSKLLLDPRWQKKRLEVLERDGFTCSCGNGLEDKVPLHVHHKKYIYGRFPWDYPMDNFETLCEKCHKSEHKIETKKLSEKELNAIYHHDSLYVNPKRAKEIGLEIDSIREKIKKEEQGRNNFELLMAMLKIVHNLNQERISLRIDMQYAK